MYGIIELARAIKGFKPITVTSYKDIRSISANPLECDCHLSWLPDWLRDNVDRVIIGPSPPTCVQPEELAGTPLASLARYYFTCPKPDAECVGAGHSSRSTEMGDVGMQICSSTSATCCAEVEVIVSEATKCPPGCTCESDGVYCSDLNLTEIPSPIPTETTQLYLERNQISHIRSDRLAHLTKLHTFALGQNPLHCDCNGKWLNSFFRQHFLDNGIALCHSPKNMRYKSIYHSKPSDFVCPWRRRRLRRTTSSSTNQTIVNEDMANALYLDAEQTSVENSVDEHGWQLEAGSIRDGGHHSLEEQESMLIAAKCLPCLINPCSNAGRCLERGQLSYTCECKAPFHGSKCQLQENVCSVNPCQNGGTCEITLYTGSYKCICPKGFRGSTCAERIDNCVQNYCQNGGICEIVGSDFLCHCPPEFHGIYCERPTWNPENHVTRMDRRIPSARKMQGFGSSQVRHSPIKIRSLSVPHLETLCAYHQCQNRAICIEGQNDVYHCLCQPGFSGQYCENLHAINLPSPHSYIAIVPPSRGAFVPHGSVELEILTRVKSGVVLYYAEMVRTEIGEAPEQFLLVDLTKGHVRAMLSLNRSTMIERRSEVEIADGLFHKLLLRIEGVNITMFIDGIAQVEKLMIIPHISHSSKLDEIAANTDLLHLALSNPLYFGGAPADRLETASQIVKETQVVGMTGCLRNIQVNGRTVDIARLFGAPVDKMASSEENHSERPSPEAKHHGTAIGILPGCEPQPKAGLKLTHPKKLATNITDVGLEQEEDPDELANQALTGSCTGQACLNATNGLACQADSQRSYIRDPQTGCVSTRKISVRTCTGSCSSASSAKVADASEIRSWLHGPRLEKWWHHSQRTPERITQSCCLPIKVKHRRVYFHCADGRNYERTMKLIRRCGCDRCTASRTH
ncbi:slit 2 [Paragonimus westermani]|uniref:Slit 2 n=1 Tax=Paragonimus westermani TaxID=34504 RepID=A0A5J4NK58_9TREM|nr:slit 2 [Paragonimus westermani]